MFSFDIESGYHHFYLDPDMRDCFLFHYQGRYFRYISLPFGWGRSAMWFTKCLRPLVGYLRESFNYRVLAYIDDFLKAPSPPGRPATVSDVHRALSTVSRLLHVLDLRRNQEKGQWRASQQIEHLGFLIDSCALKVFIADRKIYRVRKMARYILLRAQRNSRVVYSE